MQGAVSIPFLHVAEATAEAVLARGVSRVGLLGTAYTMEQNFYKDKLRQAGIEVLVPEAKERAELSRVIYKELCLGKIMGTSREYYLRVIEELAAKGAQGAIMGCTEIGLLLGGQKAAVPLFDTAEIHAASAAERALAG